MTGPDCVVMCNLINLYTHAHTLENSDEAARKAQGAISKSLRKDSREIVRINQCSEKQKCFHTNPLGSFLDAFSHPCIHAGIGKKRSPRVAPGSVWGWAMNGLTRDGTAEPVSRGDQILICNDCTVVPADDVQCVKHDDRRWWILVRT